MQRLMTLFWKEWRDHRATLLALGVAAPALVLMGFLYVAVRRQMVEALEESVKRDRRRPAGDSGKVKSKKGAAAQSDGGMELVSSGEPNASGSQSAPNVHGLPRISMNFSARFTPRASRLRRAKAKVKNWRSIPTKKPRRRS